MDRQRRVAFSTSQHIIKGLLDLIYTDVWGPSPVDPLGVLGTILHSLMISLEEFGYTSCSKNQKYFRSLKSKKIWWRIKRG